MFEIPLNIPQGASLALLGAFIAGVIGYGAAKLLARIRRVEDHLTRHEESCSEHWRRNEERWQALDSKLLAIGNDIHYIRGKLDGGDQQ